MWALGFHYLRPSLPSASTCALLWPPAISCTPSSLNKLTGHLNFLKLVPILDNYLVCLVSSFPYFINLPFSVCLLFWLQFGTAKLKLEGRALAFSLPSNLKRHWQFSGGILTLLIQQFHSRLSTRPSRVWGAFFRVSFSSRLLKYFLIHLSSCPDSCFCYHIPIDCPKDNFYAFKLPTYFGSFKYGVFWHSGEYHLE